MRRSIYTNREMEAAALPELGLETLQGAPMFRPMGTPQRIPRSVVRAMDPQRRSVPYDQRPPAEGAPGSYPRGQVVSGSLDDSEASGSIYLIAVPRDVLPPVFYGNAMLQRMRAVLMSPHAAASSDFAEHVINIPFEDLTQAFESHVSAHPAPRPVTGEILRDEHGSLYERTGSTIRRLRSLASSRRGELLESPVSEDRELSDCPAFSASVRQKTFHQFFRDPGESRVLCWGEYKSLLREQVSKPEHLRDSHRLSCYVQVYETMVPRTPEAFACECCGDISAACQLFELTEALAKRLKIASLLPAVRDFNQERTEGIIAAGDRVVRLRLAIDPTADVSTAKPVEPQEPVAPLSAAVAVPETPDCALKSSIPERFLSPWENRLTRQQVMTEMKSPEGSFVRLQRWVDTMRLGAELKKWRRQLWGKSADEQLWGIRPPQGSLRFADVNDWAKTTLAAAGYDANVMLQEWEIFWRQKGL